MNAPYLAFLAGIAVSALGAMVSLIRGQHRCWENVESQPAFECETIR